MKFTCIFMIWHDNVFKIWSSLNTVKNISDGKENQPPKIDPKAEYYPDRNDLLVKGDSEKTIEFLKNNPEVVNQGVTLRSHTVLHIAISTKRGMKLIEEIVAGAYDYTALHFADRDRNLEAVVLMITKNPRLPLLRDNRGFTPLDIALKNVSIYQKRVVEYLYSVTKGVVDGNPFSGVEGASTLCDLIQAHFYDIALCLVKEFPTVATTKSNRFDMYGLEMMVRRPFAFQSGTKLTWRHNLIYSKIRSIMQGIKSILHESDRYMRNSNGDTAKFIFTEAHKDLVKEGRDWLKDTSGSCMIVGALIATVAFAAAFTVPGGNISDSNNALNGTPIFLGQSSFTVFAVSDALALFSSITSVLMFLAIYTSRFSEGDFLKSLPQKLIFGLATLFISMVAILVAFGASLLIVVGSRFGQALIPITLFGCCPLALFALLQLPLFVEMVRTTYWGGLFTLRQNYPFSTDQICQ
ncbi:hypothetical protein MKX03_011586 [Papaver bracteatum]|nr:hypothetical protein MKX03_011586 [Papaver bracteatum]